MLKMSYLISLHPVLFENIAHVKYFLNFDFVFSPCVRLCICLCHCICRLRIDPDAVLFPTMYEMLIGMLKSSKYRCFIFNRLMADGEDCGGYARRLWRLCEKKKARVRSAPFGSDNKFTISIIFKTYPQVATFAVSALASNNGRMGKPFNPLLGETYQLEQDDFRIFCEQVQKVGNIIQAVLF